MTTKDDVIISRGYLESWVIDLLNDIKESADKGENYDLHIEAETVMEIATAYCGTSWIEIY